VFHRISLDHPVLSGETYRFHYTISRNGRRVRIPLAVPEIPTDGSPGSVVVEAVLPPGYAIAGDTFPVFEQKTPRDYVAELANIPNHVELEIGSGADARAHARWMTPTNLSDCGVVVLLAAGSIGRLLLRKRLRAPQ